MKLCRPDCGELLDKASDRLKCKKCESNYCEICLQVYHNDNPCDIVLRNTLENTYKSFQIKYPYPYLGSAPAANHP